MELVTISIIKHNCRKANSSYLIEVGAFLISQALFLDGKELFIMSKIKNLRKEKSKVFNTINTGRY